MNYIAVYYELLDAIEQLSNEERGQLLTVMLKYGRGDELDTLTGGASILWPLVRAQIDRAKNHYADVSKKRSTAAKRRAQKQEHTNASESMQMQQEHANADKRSEAKRNEAMKNEPNKSGSRNESNEMKDAIIATHHYDGDELNRCFEVVLKFAFDGGIRTREDEHGAIVALIKQYSYEWVTRAMSEASDASASARNWAYITKILQNWKKAGGIQEAYSKRE